MSTRTLLEQRAAVVAEMRTLSADTVDFTDEQRQRWDALKQQADHLQAKIDRAAVVEDLERRMQGQPVGSGDRNFDRQLAEVGILDVIRASMGATDRRAGLARENSEEMARRSGRAPQGLYWNMSAGADMERRVVSTTTPSGMTGGTLVPTDYRPDLFLDRLRAATVVRSMGARVLGGLQGNLSIPRLKQSATTGWVAENQALTPSDVGFDSVTMGPKHAGGIVELSRQILQQASPDIEALVRDDFGKVLAEVLDRAAIAGTGASNQPRGILSTSGIGSVAISTNGGALTADHIADLIGTVEDTNAAVAGNTLLGQAPGSVGFLTNTKVRRAVLKAKDGQGNYIGEEGFFRFMPRRYSNTVPASGTKGTGTNLSALLYGDWSELLIGFWSELDIMVSPYASGAWEKGNVQVRAFMTCDVVLRTPEAFASIQDIVA